LGGGGGGGESDGERASARLRDGVRVKIMQARRAHAEAVRRRREVGGGRARPPREKVRNPLDLRVAADSVRPDRGQRQTGPSRILKLHFCRIERRGAGSFVRGAAAHRARQTSAAPHGGLALHRALEVHLPPTAPPQQGYEPRYHQGYEPHHHQGSEPRRQRAEPRPRRPRADRSQPWAAPPRQQPGSRGGSGSRGGDKTPPSAAWPCGARAASAAYSARNGSSGSTEATSAELAHLWQVARQSL
jgi:hypothetical protein